MMHYPNGQSESAASSSKLDDVSRSVTNLHEAFQTAIANYKQETDERIDAMQKRITHATIWAVWTSSLGFGALGLSVYALSR
jgi:cation transport regulator ChaB